MIPLRSEYLSPAQTKCVLWFFFCAGLGTGVIAALTVMAWLGCVS